MKRTVLLSIVFSLLLLNSDADESRTVKAVDFFPLVPNMMWQFDIEKTRGKRTFNWPFRIKVEDSTHNYKGQKAYSFKTRLTSGKRRKEVLQREYYYVAKTGDILCYRRDNGPIQVPLSPPQTVLKSSLTVGLKWTWKGTYKGRAASSSTEVKRFEKLTLEKKVYDCVVIHSVTTTVKPETTQLRTLWFAKGVGLVKEKAIEKWGKSSDELLGQMKSYSRPAPK
jgi:hypothetical protein